MEEKNPLVRPSVIHTADDGAEVITPSDDYSWVPWILGLTGLVLLGIGFIGGRISVRPKPPAPISTRQALVPVEIAGCQYWFATFGEPTNANFAVSLTHSGSCSNFNAHKCFMQ